jgi:hypothetical protein
MKTFVSDVGCSMSFDEEIDEEEMNKRLSWMGDTWKEVKK